MELDVYKITVRKMLPKERLRLAARLFPVVYTSGEARTSATGHPYGVGPMAG
jgi:hypothetical protein